MRATISLLSGYRLEFWAKGPGAFRIWEGSMLLWHVPAFTDYPDFFSYTHREESNVTVECDAEAAILWAYGYDPLTVRAMGITIWESEPDRLTLRTGPEIGAWMRSDPARPVMHFSPVRQWMNDPNGLCKIGGDWHLFYQFHPASTDWGPMHWGHAVSKDLFNWTHMPVFLHPEQNLWRLAATGGAFSGNAFEDRGGELFFFYTERLPAYDLFTGYREIQKLARPERGIGRASGAETVISTRPVREGVKHDFRDPKVWWDETAGAYRMVLGAALHGDPAVLLYGSANLTEWTYLGPIYRAPAHYRKSGARAVECPDFFPLDGRWVLVMGFVGYSEPNSGRHNLMFALVGEFRHDRFVPHTDRLQVLDFGTDFYAMQSFRADGRQIAMAWLFNWEYRRPEGSPYSGEMSLPRELRLDAAGRLVMQPVRELEATWAAVPLETGVTGTYTLEDAPFDLRMFGDLDRTTITATQGNHLTFEIVVSNGSVSVRLPQDDGTISYRAECASATDLRILHDRGIIEVFVDNGAICGTRRSYKNVSPDRLAIRSRAKFDLFARRAIGV